MVTVSSCSSPVLDKSLLGHYTFHLQALPLVSTIWGVLLFGEYHRSSKRTYILLASMLLLFIAAVGLLMGSSGTRQNQ